MSTSPTYPDHLRPANPDDVAEAMPHALRYDRRKRRAHNADSVIARVAADLLVRHFLAAGYVILAGGYVIMKKGE